MDIIKILTEIVSAHPDQILKEQPQNAKMEHIVTASTEAELAPITVELLNGFRKKPTCHATITLLVELSFNN